MKTLLHKRKFQTSINTENGLSKQIKESELYLQNAKDLLKKAGRDNGYFKDGKYVRTACGTAYLGSLLAADAYLVKKGKVILKKNCKIGTHSVVMPGVTIGENTIVGAFSFVNKSLPDNVTAYGVPARIIKV